MEEAMAEARILVVDDDEVALKSLCRVLSKRGHHAVAAKNAATAIRLLERSSFDLVISDLVMEDMDGLELLSTVKHRWPDIEVILVTGFASIPTAIDATKLGAYHYLEKPIKLEELELYVRGACEKKQLTRENQDLRDGWAHQNQPPRFVGNSGASATTAEVCVSSALP